MKHLSLLTAILLILFVAGCSQNSTAPDQSKNNSTGDQKLPDEAQKILDQYLPESLESQNGEQPAYLDSLPVELIDNCDIYSVTFLWGDIFNSATPSSDTTDWSGTLSMNADGVVYVFYEIDFESGEDSVLIHNNPTFAAWISLTHNDLDGLSFLVFLPRDVEYFAAPELTFETGPITKSFYFYELADLTAFYPVDTSNGLIVYSRLIWENACPGGAINGTWIKDGWLSDSGSFNGYWLDYLGDTVGIMSGIFWSCSTNVRGKFAGSVSGLVTDQVIFEFEGHWYYDDPRMCPMCGEGHGIFQGQFQNLMDGRTGYIAGEFGDYSLPPDDIEMPMNGIWHYHCPWNDVADNSQ
jgi:hypothetical protein